MPYLALELKAQHSHTDSKEKMKENRAKLAEKWKMEGGKLGRRVPSKRRAKFESIIDMRGLCMENAKAPNIVQKPQTNRLKGVCVGMPELLLRG